MSHVGQYKGVRYHRKRLCDVLAVDYREQFYFLLDRSGEYTSDHFRTKRELFTWIDDNHQDLLRPEGE